MRREAINARHKLPKPLDDPARHLMLALEEADIIAHRYSPALSGWQRARVRDALQRLTAFFARDYAQIGKGS